MGWSRRRVLVLLSGLLAGPALGVPRRAGAQAPGSAPAVDVTRKDRLKLVYSTVLPTMQNIQLWLARDQGIFQKYGLEVDITMINGAGPTLMGVISGQSDLGLIDPTQLLLAVAKGEKLRGVVNTSPKETYVLLGHSGIKSLKDLAGKRIGISQPGTTSQTLVEMVLKKHGVDSGTVQWVAVGGSGSRFQALLKKRIDAGLGQIGYAIRGERDGVVVLANLGDELGEMMYYLYGARQSTIDRNRAAMVKFAAGMVEGTQVVLADRALAVDTNVKYVPGLERADALREYDALKKASAWGPDGKLSPTALAFTSKMLIDQGLLKAAPTADDVFATDIVDAALRLIAQTR